MAVQLASEHIDAPRGGASMDKKTDVKKPTIVETYKFGNTTVNIASDSIRTDPVEIEQILKEHYAAAWRIVRSCLERGEEV